MKYRISLLLLLAPLITAAQINKCESEDGAIYYSQEPCKEAIRTTKVNDTVISGAPAAPHKHYNFQNTNYKTKAYLTVQQVRDKYECSELCQKDSRCVVATYFNQLAKKRKQGQCKLRDSIKNKHLGLDYADSWVK